MIEIRRVFEAEDVAASDPDGELRANDERLRRQAGSNRVSDATPKRCGAV